MRGVKNFLSLVACAAMLTASSPALAASGTALGVKPQAEAALGGQSRVLVVGADVFIGDLVRTGSAGLVQIKFSDGTELVVGPNSALTIEDYLLRDNNTAGQFAINALAGTFRFATGSAPKDSYLITTPTGTIGVRGTAFDLNVDDEESRVLLFHGAVRLCNTRNQCVTLDDTCEVGTYDLSDAITLGPGVELEDDIRRAMQENFIYAQSQAPLMREFWVDIARQCLNRPPPAPPVASLAQNESSEPEPETEGEGEGEGQCPPPYYC
jgi:hypothetical protein